MHVIGDSVEPAGGLEKTGHMQTWINYTGYNFKYFLYEIQVIILTMAIETNLLF